MTAASRVSKIIAVFTANGVDVDLHAEHDTLMFVAEKKVSFAKELKDAGAYFDSEYDCWTINCSA